MMKKQSFRFLMAAFAVVWLSGCSMFESQPVGNMQVPEPAKAVELKRYVGRWYEVARYEAGFQRGCEAVTADYSLRDDGKIKVVNACRQDSVTGEARSAEAVAYILEDSNGAKLRVSFFQPFYGDYWIMDRADDYSWAIVGEPSGKYLWFLFRAAHPPKAALAHVKKRAAAMGYDLSLLRYTQQP